MIKYTVSYPKAHSRFINIECVIDNIKDEQVLIQLPTWRPGRYELGNFAKNIQCWKAFDEKENPLHFQKKDSHSWLLNTKNCKSLHIQYNYYAADLNAGSTFIDDDQLYMNPVNCLIYVKEKMQEECFLNLKLPENYQVAIGLDAISKFSFKAKNYDELADSPLIASASLKHDSYKVNNFTFHLWFQGECKPDFEKIKTDFKKFTEIQIKMMNGFPVKEYHFLFQIIPYKYYHGVEHTTSTVIALGPSYDIMKKNKMYDELLGVSSHELFHTWNIKTIRPKEMFPYNFSKENYSRLGYVAEGVTTYYGDVFLLRSGVFTEQDYFDNLNTTLQRHFDNYGRFNYSVADSSLDTWLDGYVPGIPDRKVSIYVEGSLCAFMTDILIRQATQNQKSLDDVMRILYHEFALKQKGYTEDDYKTIIEQTAEISFTDFFEKFIYGTTNYEPLLKTCFDYLGLELQKLPAKNYAEHYFGLKSSIIEGKLKITAIAPHSPAHQSGLLKDDEIVSINKIKLNNNLSDWSEYFENNIELTINSADEIKIVKLQKNDITYYPTINVVKQTSLSKQQESTYQQWKSLSNF